MCTLHALLTWVASVFLGSHCFRISQTLGFLRLLEPHRDLVPLLSAVSDKLWANRVLRTLLPCWILKTDWKPFACVNNCKGKYNTGSYTDHLLNRTELHLLQHLSWLRLTCLLLCSLSWWADPCASPGTAISWQQHLHPFLPKPGSAALFLSCLVVQVHWGTR